MSDPTDKDALCPRCGQSWLAEDVVARLTAELAEARALVDEAEEALGTTWRYAARDRVSAATVESESER